MAGLFDELDVAGAEDNPWSIPDSTYPGVVSDLDVKKNAKGNMGMTFKYKVTEGEYARIQELLGREPNMLELGLFSVMWSEH